MNVVKILLLGFLGLFALFFVALIYVGVTGPQTSIYPGNQLPAKFQNEVRSLKLVDESDKIRFFYSDGMLDIKDGMYFVTNQNLVLYSNQWNPPAIIIPMNKITAIEPTYHDSFFDDSMVFVSTTDGESFVFPLSSEYRLDRKFVEYLNANKLGDKEAVRKEAESEK